MIINYHGHPIQFTIEHNVLLVNGTMEVNLPPVINLHDRKVIALQATGEILIDGNRDYVSDLVEHAIIKALL